MKENKYTVYWFDKQLERQFKDFSSMKDALRFKKSKKYTHLRKIEKCPWHPEYESANAA